MAKISKTKISLPILITASIFALTVGLLSPTYVSAEYNHAEIPEISGTIAIPDPTTSYSDQSQIVLSVAMAVSENSVENGKAIWGKLDIVQGFLVYKIGVLANDDVYHKVIVDAGTGESLYVSQGITKENWKHSKHSNSESHKK